MLSWSEKLQNISRKLRIISGKFQNNAINIKQISTNGVVIIKINKICNSQSKKTYCIKYSACITNVFTDKLIESLEIWNFRVRKPSQKNKLQIMTS